MILTLYLWNAKKCTIPEALTLFRKIDPSVHRAELLANSLLIAYDKNGWRLSILGRLLLGSVKAIRQISGKKMSTK